MDRLIQLLSKPKMEMSILDQLEITLYVIPCMLVVVVLFSWLEKCLKGRGRK